MCWVTRARRCKAVCGSTLFLVLFAACVPEVVHAQATLPPAGTATLDFTYQFFDGGDHLFSTNSIDGLCSRGYCAEGNRWFLGDTWAHSYFGTLDVGLHPRLALTVGAAIVASAYDGRAPVNDEIDDGQFRTTLQDGMLRLRSPFVIGLYLVTPFVGASFPLTDYALDGHTAPGRGLVEVQIGGHVARGLGAFGSFGYAALDVGYGMAVNVPDRDLGRLSASLRIGHYFSRRLTASAVMSQLYTFNGVEWVSADPTAPSIHGGGSVTLHNQVSAARSTILGGTVEWALARAFALHGGLHTTVWGENVDDALLATAGVSWSFRYLNLDNSR